MENIPIIYPDHIFIQHSTLRAFELVCHNCRKVHTQSLPVSVDMFIVISKQFIKEHRECPKKD